MAQCMRYIFKIFSTKKKMGGPKASKLLIFSTYKFDSGDRAHQGLSPESKKFKKEYVELKL